MDGGETACGFPVPILLSASECKILVASEGHYTVITSSLGVNTWNCTVGDVTADKCGAG